MLVAPGRLMIPMGALSGSTLPSLDYDFTALTAIPTGVTFSRTSHATMWDSGALVYGPHNLVTSSQDFTAAVWTKSNCSATGDATTDPLGTTTADLLTGTATTVNASQAGVVVPLGARIAVSFYAKQGPAANVWMRLRIASGAEVASQWFNLSTGAAGTTTSTANIIISSPTSTDAGSGWWRVSAVFQTTGFTSMTIGAGPGNSNGNGGLSGDTVYLWGAQCEIHTSARTYNATTASAVYAARFDQDPVTFAAKGLLIEEARTNLFLNSATGVTQSCTVTAAAHTLSFYGTGTITLTGVSTAGPLVGTGAANRVTLVFTPTAGSLTLTVSGSCTNVQLELGSFVTSPIVTVGATVTRAADVVTITLGSWFNTSAGTLAAEFSFPDLFGSINSTVWQIDDGTTNARLFLYGTSTTATNFDIRVGGVQQINILRSGWLTAGGVAKVACAWATNDCQAAFGGTLGTADTSIAVPTGLTTLRLGATSAGAQGRTHLRRLRVYRARKSNADLQALTT